MWIYTVDENDIDSYTSSINGFEITNTLIPSKEEDGKKIGDQDKKDEPKQEPEKEPEKEIKEEKPTKIKDTNNDKKTYVIPKTGV